MVLAMYNHALAKKSQKICWGVRLKTIYFLVICGDRMNRGISMVERWKHKIGLAPVSPDHGLSTSLVRK